MIVALAFSHKDAKQAERLMLWMEFLGGCSEYMVVLIPSYIAYRMDRHECVLQSAKRCFKNVLVRPMGEAFEKGWPRSPNHMFRKALDVVEEIGEPMFWLEPDAIPVCTSWLDQIRNEYISCGKPFMGNYVNTNKPHMTGVACYSHEWRRYAPELHNADYEAWDTFAAHQVLPNARITPLIQHVFGNPRIHNLSILDGRAVVFHQDKVGMLIRILDSVRFAGKFLDGRNDAVHEFATDMQYYYTANASRPLKVPGFVIQFEPTSAFGGTLNGVYATKSESEIAALSVVISDPTSGVELITEEQYRAQLKKKPRLKGSERSLNFTQNPMQSPNAPARAVVESPLPSPNRLIPEPPKPEHAIDVVTVGQVTMATPIDPVVMPKRRGRPPKHQTVTPQ